MASNANNGWDILYQSFTVVKKNLLVSKEFRNFLLFQFYYINWELLFRDKFVYFYTL